MDKKKKFVPDERGVEEEGVLSIPPEDPPNNCKSKFASQLSLSVSFVRVLLVPVLSALLHALLLPLLEGEGIFRAQARLHQKVHEVDS